MKKGFPLNAVQEQIYHDLNKYVYAECNHQKEHISTERVEEVINKNVIEVEEKISQEMKDASRVDLMHDGWSNGSTYYCGLMATYLRENLVYISTGWIVLIKRR